ncbi:MAG: hypothetical protein M1835_002638 [Candelina submexicana]|nr:MAG: hypothetical protein M1835_002638 [Candelina submexicana]
MEAPGFITLLYIMNTLPKELGIASLPRENWVMAGLFSNLRTQTVHYIYRALLAPLLLNPSMSPMQPTVWAGALCFQLINATSIGGWLAGYGPTGRNYWAGRWGYIEVGLMIFGVFFLANIFHDDELREIRRAAARNQKRAAEARGEKAGDKSVDKVYMMPESGLFRAVLFPHYFCEWIEWAGFWMVGGLQCTPARSFLLSEISTMTPRALQGKRWYVKKFGAEKVGSKKAVVPGLL